MNSTLVTLPLIFVIIVGFATQLEDLAKISSDKALNFAEDMNKAMECATKGIPITVCSPNITTYDFSAETTAFSTILEDMEKELSPALIDLEAELANKNATDIYYDESTNTTVIIYVIEGSGV